MNTFLLYYQEIRQAKNNLNTQQDLYNGKALAEENLNLCVASTRLLTF